MTENDKQALISFFKNHRVSYHLYEHQPVFTVFEEPEVTAIDGVAVTEEEIPKPHFKTLFLRDHKGVFFLVSVLEEKRVDIKGLREVLGCGRLSFGKEEDLLALLRSTPGGVTPFGLLFDKENQVTYALDEEALNFDTVSFHPMRNDQTVVLSTADFAACVEKMGHPLKTITIPERSNES